jgi:hypothetical protein
MNADRQPAAMSHCAFLCVSAGRASRQGEAFPYIGADRRRQESALRHRRARVALLRKQERPDAAAAVRRPAQSNQGARRAEGADGPAGQRSHHAAHQGEILLQLYTIMLHALSRQRVLLCPLKTTKTHQSYQKTRKQI